MVEGDLAEQRVAQPFGPAGREKNLVAAPPLARFGAVPVEVLDESGEIGIVGPAGRGQAEPGERGGGVLVPVDIDVTIPLCNVGVGLAVLRGYHLQGEPASHVAQDLRGPARHLRGDLPPPARAFSAQQRDLLIITRRAGFWQAALRDPRTRLYEEVTRAIETRGRVTVDVLYGDHEGGQPSITRFVLLPEADSWRCDATRYWSLPASRELRDFGFT